jgi:hypothetical protein
MQVYRSNEWKKRLFQLSTVNHACNGISKGRNIPASDRWSHKSQMHATCRPTMYGQWTICSFNFLSQLSSPYFSSSLFIPAVDYSVLPYSTEGQNLFFPIFDKINLGNKIIWTKHKTLLNSCSLSISALSHSHVIICGKTLITTQIRVFTTVRDWTLS